MINTFHIAAVLDVFFQTFTLAFLAVNKPTSKVEDSTTDQSSGLTNPPNTLSGGIIDPADPAVSVPEGGSSAKDLFSITPESLNPFNKYTDSPSPFPALPEDKRAGIIYHNDTSSSILGSQDHLITAYSPSLLPGNDWSRINVSETNTVEGNTPNTSQFQSDDNSQDGLNILPHPDNQEEGSTHRHKEDSSFDSKDLTLSLPYNSEESNQDISAEGSGSGSGLGNRLDQEFDGVTTVPTDLSAIPNSTITFKVDITGKKSTATGIKMDSETGDDTDETGSKLSGKKCETAAEKDMEGNESELSGKEDIGEGIQDTGIQRVRKVDSETDESARQLDSTAGCDTSKEKESESVVGKITHTETGSGDEIESNFGVFSWPEDIHGSGEGGGDGGENGKGKGKKFSDDKESIKTVSEKESDAKGDGSEDEVVSERRDGLQLSVSQDKPTAMLPLFGSSEENGDIDGHDEESQSTSLDSQIVGLDNFTLEDNREGDRNGGLGSEEHIEGGAKEDSEAAVTRESVHKSTSMDRLLSDAAKSPVLGRLVPLHRLTDGSEATEEQMEGKCSSALIFSSALLLCDRTLLALTCIFLHTSQCYIV